MDTTRTPGGMVGQRSLGDDDGPPVAIRIRYYLWDTRVPPSWLGWVERDIASPSWLLREVARFLVAFFLLALIFGALQISLVTVTSLLLGVAGIVAGKELLRRVAYAYQRYGWDWTEAKDLGVAPYMRIGYAVLFTVVFVLLTR